MKYTVFKYILAATLLLPLAACERFEMKEGAGDGRIFRGSTEIDTKTSLGEDKSVLWQADDQISVFAGNSINAGYRVSKGAGTSDAEFSRFNYPASDESFQTGANFAVYPYSSSTSISESGEISLTLPKVQTFCPGGFSPGANPMVAVTPDTETEFFSFYNLCAILKFRLKGSGTVVSLELSGNDEELLSGPARVKPTYGKAPELVMDSRASTSVKLDCPDGVVLSEEEAAEFFFVIPPTNFTKGFKVRVLDSKGSEMSCQMEKPVNLQRRMIQPLSVLNYVPVFNDGFVHFTDTNFEKYCIDNFDDDNDGKVSTKEASRVRKIRVKTNDIVSLGGIEYFTNLSSLTAEGDRVLENNKFVNKGSLSEVDLRGNTKLAELNLYANKLTSLDLSNNPELSSLYAQFNNIKSIDLSANIKLNTVNLTSAGLTSITLKTLPLLEILTVDNCNISSIDLSGLPKLSYLDLYGNPLTELDLSKNTKLEHLVLSSSSLTTLDISSCPSLNYLYAPYLGISSLDLSNTPLLEYLVLDSGHLTSIDISHCPGLSTLSLNRNPIKTLDLSCNTNLETVLLRYMPCLKYIFFEKEQDVPDFDYIPGSGSPTAEKIYGDILRIEPETVNIFPSGGMVKMEVLSNKPYSITSSLPSWLTQKELSSDGPVTTLTLFASANPSSSPRSTKLSCKSSSLSASCNLVQAKKMSTEDWMQHDFYHRSLFLMQRQPSWIGSYDYDCGYKLFQSNWPGKLEVATVCNKYLSSATLNTLIDMLGSDYTDARRYMQCWVNFSIITSDIKGVVDETEQAYPTVCGLSFDSSFDGNKINVDLSLYAKVADKYNIFILLLEDKLTGTQTVESGSDSNYQFDDNVRLCLSDPTGNPVTVSSAGTVTKLSLSGTLSPDWNKDNLRILAIVTRPFGNQTVLSEFGKDYYVDNCASGKAGGSLPLNLTNTGSGGGNEDITPGYDIQF